MLRLHRFGHSEDEKGRRLISDVTVSMLELAMAVLTCLGRRLPRENGVCLRNISKRSSSSLLSLDLSTVALERLAGRRTLRDLTSAVGPSSAFGRGGGGSEGRR